MHKSYLSLFLSIALFFNPLLVASNRDAEPPQEQARPTQPEASTQASTPEKSTSETPEQAIKSTDVVKNINEELLSTTTPAYSPEEAEKLNQLYATWRGQLEALQSAFQHLSQLVATQKVSPNDPYGAFDWLQKMSMIVGKARNLPYAPLTTKKLIHFFNFNKTLTKAVGAAYKHQLNIRTDIGQLNEALDKLSVLVQTRAKTDISMQVVASYAIETERLVQKLHAHISKSGLTWFNRLYRNVSSFNKTFKVTPTLFSLGVLGVIGSGILYLAPKGTFKGTFLESSETALKYDDGQDVDNNSAMAKFLHAGTLYFDPNKPEYHRTMMAIAIFNMLGNFHNMGAHTYISQKWNELDAYFKGSTFDDSSKVIKYIDNITLDDPMFDCVRDLFGPFNDILRFLENPDLYIQSGMNIPKCVLLVGTPGSGKTLSARALAGSINKLFVELGRFEKCGFIDVEPWELHEIDNVIKEAKANAPCVIFIDEFHLFGGGTQINSNAMGLSKLLTEVDKIDKSKDPTQQIFVVTATNRPDLLAKALLRHGRFGLDARIEFPIPSFEQRKSVLEALCKKSAVDTTDIDLDYLATLTQGSSFSAISKVFERAGFLAKQHAEGITYDHLYRAFNEVIRGLVAKNHLDREERTIVATHYAGFALAHLLLDTPVQLEAVTIQAPARNIQEQLDFLAKMENLDEDGQHTSEHGAIYTYKDHENFHLTSKSDPAITCKLLLAGRVAQTVLLGTPSTFGKENKKQAYAEATTILLDGLTMEDLAKSAREDLKERALAMVETCEAELETFFTAHKKQLRIVADLLAEKEFLTVGEIKTALNMQ